MTGKASLTPGGNPFRVDGQTASVGLGHGLEAMVDLHDLDRISHLKWCAALRDKTAYAVTNLPLRIAGKKGFTMLLHHWLMGRGVGPVLIDHADGNGLNNRLANLRFTNKSGNGANRGAPSNNTSGCKGVHFDTRKQQWVAQIQNMGKTFFLGRYSSKEAAACVYQNAASSIFGEFAHGGGG